MSMAEVRAFSIAKAYPTQGKIAYAVTKAMAGIDPPREKVRKRSCDWRILPISPAMTLTIIFKTKVRDMIGCAFDLECIS